jgi:hypothetical protein
MNQQCGAVSSKRWIEEDEDGRVEGCSPCSILDNVRIAYWSIPE